MLQELKELQREIKTLEETGNYDESDSRKMYLAENYLPAIIGALKDLDKYKQSQAMMVKVTKESERLANGFKATRNYLEGLAKSYGNGDIIPNKKCITLNLANTVRMMDRIESGEERVSVG